jgi:hypothetical protein
MAKYYIVKATGDYNVRTYVPATVEVAARSFIMLCDTIIQGYAMLDMIVDVFNINDDAVMITVNGKFADKFEGTTVEFVKDFED